MKKLMAVAVLGVASLLAGCNDGIYGEYINKQYGVRLDVQKMSSSLKTALST